MIFFPFKPFGILNFAIAKWFCHVIFFNKFYLCCFFSRTNMIFNHKKVLTWKSQHFYHKEVIMLSFLHRPYYCWKCEFEIDARIENYNHHDGEKLLFYKKVHVKT